MTNPGPGERILGSRLNAGKPRHDLIPVSAKESLAKVLTFGAQKYGDRNWEKGLPWMTCYASLERHLVAFVSGEDFDQESGLLHLDHALTNIAFIIEYYRTHPELDDRPKHTRTHIGLDIDDVLADFVPAYCERFGLEQDVSSWHFDEHIGGRMEELNKDRDFWLSLKPKISSQEMPFEPHCYITARSIPVEWTMDWLRLHKFPLKPVISVGFNNPKPEAVVKAGCKFFVDDGYHNYKAINEAGVCCFLFDTPQNRRYDVGVRRISSLKELK